MAFRGIGLFPTATVGSEQRGRHRRRGRRISNPKPDVCCSVVLDVDILLHTDNNDALNTVQCSEG